MLLFSSIDKCAVFHRNPVSPLHCRPPMQNCEILHVEVARNYILNSIFPLILNSTRLVIGGLALPELIREYCADRRFTEWKCRIDLRHAWLLSTLLVSRLSTKVFEVSYPHKIAPFQLVLTVEMLRINSLEECQSQEDGRYYRIRKTDTSLDKILG